MSQGLDTSSAEDGILKGEKEAQCEGLRLLTEYEKAENILPIQSFDTLKSRKLTRTYTPSKERGLNLSRGCD
jgi:hypothetical protein